MKAHLENLTDLPKQQVRTVVMWTLRELDIDRPDLLVRIRPARGRKHHGRFYAHARTHWAQVWKGDHVHEIRVQVPDDVSHLIMARVPNKPWGRTDRQLRGGPPAVRPENWIESLVCIIAHEGHHFREFLYPPKGGKSHLRRTKRGVVTVGPKRHSEVDAEWAEYRLLKRWRER